MEALKVRFKSEGSITVSLKNANEAREEIRSHLQSHSFSGWRYLCGVFLNMAEVQAMWIEDMPPEDAPTPPEGA